MSGDTSNSLLTFNVIQVFPPVAETSISAIYQSLSVLSAVKDQTSSIVFALVSTTASLPLTLTPTITMTTTTALIACNNFGMPIWLAPFAGSITATSSTLTLYNSNIYITGFSGVTSYTDAIGTTTSFSASPIVIVINSITSALSNALILSNINGSPSVWIAPNEIIWIAGKGGISTNPTITGFSAPSPSLANTCFVVSCNLSASSLNWYSRSSSSFVGIRQGLLWDNSFTSVVLIGRGGGLGTAVTLNTNVGSAILSGGVVGSDILLQTSSSVTKFNSHGQKLWSVTASSTTFTKLVGHRLFGNANNSAVLTTQTNLGVTLTSLILPQYWVADLDSSTGIPLAKSILYAPAVITGNDESLLVVGQTASLQQNTETISISPSGSRTSIIEYKRQYTIPLTQTYYPSPYTLTNLVSEISIACPQNTWLLCGKASSSQEYVHIDCDGSVIWRATLSNAQAPTAPLLNPNDTTFALLITTSSTDATWNTFRIMTSGILIVNLHTGIAQVIRPTSIPSNITSAAAISSSLITVTTPTTLNNFDLSSDLVGVGVSTTTTPLIWPGGLSANVSSSNYNLYYRNKWVFQTDATDIITALEANFVDSATIIYVILKTASLYSYGSSLGSLTDPDTFASATLILVALNSDTGAPLWTLPMDNVPETVQLTTTNTSLYVLITQSTVTVFARYSDPITLLNINPRTGNINYPVRNINAQNIPFSGGLKTPINNLLVRDNRGFKVFSPVLPSILTVQLGVDQAPTVAGAQFMGQGSRNLVIATTASNQFIQFGQNGCSKAAMALSTSQVELNAPLSANQRVQVMGGGLEVTPTAKVTAAKPLSFPIISVTREAAPSSGMTICNVSPNYYIQIGTNSFPSIAPLISNTGTNLMVLVSRQSQISATIDFGSSIPISAKLLECTPGGMLVIAVDVQIVSPLTAPIFYDSRGIQCSISTNTPAFASSLYMTYLIQYTRLTPTRRLLQIEGSSKTLCLRTDPFGNYVISGTIATNSSVGNLYVTDATSNTTVISKGSNGSYYCKINASGGFTTLKPMNSSIADFVLDVTGQNVYVLGSTALIQYDNSDTATTLTTYSSVTNAFWVSQTYSNSVIAVIGNTIGTLTNGTFTSKGNILTTPLSVLSLSPFSLAILVTASALYAFNTTLSTLPKIWTLTMNNVSYAAINSDNTLSIAFSGNTTGVPQFTTFDGASITTSVTGLTSAALYCLGNIPIIEPSCSITAQPVSGVWLAAGMPSTPINLGWAADVTQSTLAALTLTPAAIMQNVPFALASDTATSGTISLTTPLTVLGSNTTYSLPAAGAAGQVKLLVAASTAAVTVGGSNGRTITVSGTTGVKLVFANQTWYQV